MAKEEIVKMFDYLEGRWQDEKGYEEFSEYRTVAERSVTENGFEFVSLEAEPVRLTFKKGNTEYELSVNNDQIVERKRVYNG